MASNTQQSRAQWAPLRAQIIALAVANAPPPPVAAFNIQLSLNEIDLPDALLDLLMVYADTEDGNDTPEDHLPILTEGPPQWPLLLSHTIQDVADMPFSSEQQQAVTDLIQHCLFPLMTNIFHEHPDVRQMAFWPATGSGNLDSERQEDPEDPRH